MVDARRRFEVTPERVALWSALAGAVLALLALGGPAATTAAAETYCAPSPCGEGTPVATIKAAVGMADANSGPDTVAIGPGTFETESEGCGGLFVSERDTYVRGAGIGQTILTFPQPAPSFGGSQRVICGHMHLSDVTLRLPSDETPGHNSSVEGIDLYSGLVERVRIDAPGSTYGSGDNDGRAVAGLLRTGAAHDLEVDFDPTQDTEGIQTGYLTEFRRIRVTAGRGAFSTRVAQEPGQPPMRASDLVLRGNFPLSVSNETGLDSRLELSDAVLDTSVVPSGEYTSAVGVYNGQVETSIQLGLDRVTMVGNGAPTGTAIEAYGQGGPFPTVLEARHVVVAGFARTLLLGRFGGDVRAVIDYSNVDLGPGRVVEEGTEGTASTVFGPGNRAGSPLFGNPASGDYRLLPGSPAIDVGGPDLIPGGATDLAGDPRPTDGDGDGVALADAGAYEAPRMALVDRTATVEILGKRLRLDRSGAARLRLRCPSDEASPPCAGSLLLQTVGRVPFGGKRRQVVLARGRFSIGAGRVASIELKLKPGKSTLVREEPAARRVQALASVHDAAGNTAAPQKGMKLVPARPPKARPR